MTTTNPYQAPASDVTGEQPNHPYQPRIFTAEAASVDYVTLPMA